MDKTTDVKISRKKSSRKMTKMSRPVERLKFKPNTRTFLVKKESMNCKTDSREKVALHRTKMAAREVLPVVTSIFI